MADEKKVITLDDFEQRLMVSGLMDFRNDLLKEEKPTEDIPNYSSSFTTKLILFIAADFPCMSIS